MMRPYAEQIDSKHYEIRIGHVVWAGFGLIDDLTEFEYREIVRKLMADNLALLTAWETPYEDGNHV